MSWLTPPPPPRAPRDAADVRRWMAEMDEHVEAINRYVRRVDIAMLLMSGPVIGMALYVIAEAARGRSWLRLAFDTLLLCVILYCDHRMLERVFPLRGLASFRYVRATRRDAERGVPPDPPAPQNPS